MKLKYCFLFFIFSIQTSFSQKDTIINYYNDKLEKSTIKPNSIRIIETIVKQNDTLFKFSRFKPNGKLATLWYSKTIDSQSKVGQFVTFDKNDSISSIKFFNQQGLKTGKSKGWFYNRKPSFEGYYKNDKREGIWKYYHFNGKIAARGFFKDDALIKSYYIDEEGNTTKAPEDCCSKSARFNGGIEMFRRKLKKFSRKLDYKLKGNLIVDYTIDIQGNITNVDIFGSIPFNVKTKLINHFESIKGWKPAVHLNRRVPTHYIMNLKF